MVMRGRPEALKGIAVSSLLQLCRNKQGSHVEEKWLLSSLVEPLPSPSISSTSSSDIISDYLKFSATSAFISRISSTENTFGWIPNSKAAPVMKIFQLLQLLQLPRNRCPRRYALLVTSSPHLHQPVQ